MTERAIVLESSTLKLGRGVRLHLDKRRDVWVLMAPERVLVLDEIAAEVVRDIAATSRPVGDLITEFADRFDAPLQTIKTDVLELLQDLTDKRFLIQ